MSTPGKKTPDAFDSVSGKLGQLQTFVQRLVALVKRKHYIRAEYRELKQEVAAQIDVMFSSILQSSVSATGAKDVKITNLLVV